MPEFVQTIDIDAAPDVVWPVLAAVEEWPRWTPTVVAAERLDAREFGLGSRVRIRQPKLPAAVWTVTDWQPGRAFTWENRAPGLLVTAAHRLAPRAGGCRLELELVFSGFFAGFVARLARDLNQRYLAQEAQGLKRHCERAAR